MQALKNYCSLLENFLPFPMGIENPGLFLFRHIENYPFSLWVIMRDFFLSPSFPYRGIENPCLIPFVIFIILLFLMFQARDKSLVSVSLGIFFTSMLIA